MSKSNAALAQIVADCAKVPRSPARMRMILFPAGGAGPRSLPRATAPRRAILVYDDGCSNLRKSACQLRTPAGKAVQPEFLQVHPDPLFRARSIFMENSGPRRQQIVKLIGSMPDAEAGGRVIALFLPLRLQLASLVSEEGYSFLFERSIHQTAQQYKWIGVPSQAHGAERLSDLRAIFAQRTHEEALAASTFLLLNFIDLVASLIGESLTVSILCSAWGDAALGAMDGDNTA